MQRAKAQRHLFSSADVQHRGLLWETKISTDMRSGLIEFLTLAFSDMIKLFSLLNYSEQTAN